MATTDRRTPFDQPADDSMQRLLCGVEGCFKRWCIRIDGQIPLCAAHRNYFDGKGDYIPNPNRLTQPTFVEPDKTLDF